MKKKTHFAALDGFRGIAAVLVAYFYHYFQYFDGNTPLSDWSGGGVKWQQVTEAVYVYSYLGVEIFFCMSGFLMCYLYYQNILDGKVDFKTYIYKRINKLFPLFWLTTIVTWIGQWFNLFTSGETVLFDNNNLFHLFVNFMGLQQFFGVSFNGPSWFLTSILICYIIYYIVTKKWKSGAIYAYMIIMCIGMFCINSKVFANVPFLTCYMGRGYLGFFWGCLLACFIKKCELINASEKKLKVTGIVLMLLYGMAFYYERVTYRYPLLGDIYMSCTLWMCTGLIILARYSKCLEKIFSLKIFQVIGATSFSIYLWNFPTDMALVTIKRYFDCFAYNSIAFWTFHLIVSMGIAFISYFFIEPRINSRFDKVFRKYLN